jgi:hypothetical protein
MKKRLLALLAYLLIFAIIFGLSIFDYMHNLAVLEIGMSAKIVDLIIILLSALSVLKTVWHIHSY